MEQHKPVLVKEVLYFLDAGPGRRFIDATIGGSGHTEAILKLGGEVLGIDISPKALRLAEERIRRACPAPKARLVQGNFRDILQIAQNAGFGRADGILFDLGIASFELEDPSLGLSFTREGPLDMRLSPELGVKAADLVNGLTENELAKLFYEFGQEKLAGQIARAIVSRRAVAPFKTTGDLRQIAEEVYGRRQGQRQKIHPATKIFMALRIAVNLEFENLKSALPQALELLKPGGKLAVISFHSGEDRIVKQFFREEEKKGAARILTRKPVVPSNLEIEKNPRARSAKLRAIEKVMSEKRKTAEKKRKINPVLAGIILIFGILAASQIAVSNKLAGRGEELARLDGELQKLTRENKILGEELAGGGALVKIASESARLGLIKPEKIIYLETSFPVAAVSLNVNAPQ